MSSPTLFIGLVSHERTSYIDSLGPDGLAEQLRSTFRDAVLAVNTGNLADEMGFHPDRRTVQASLSAELQVDRQWGRFLGRTKTGRWWFGHTLRRIKRLGRYIWSPPASTVRRLLNIELSHIDLLQNGLDSGAPWLLVLEDDAECRDVHELSDGLQGLMKGNAFEGLVNLSESFTFEELGITAMLTQDEYLQWPSSVGRRVLRSTVPATNTVCAILYSRRAAEQILSELRSIPSEPILPIDWKLNLALMRLHHSQSVTPISSWFVDPAPIRQRSMDSPAILTA